MANSCFQKEAVILAGGLGSRLREAVPDRPKALAPINGQPFLLLQLKFLAAAGFNRAIIAIGYLGYMIKEAIGAGLPGLDIVYSHESEPLGTGGALAYAALKARNDAIFAMNGDTWLETDFNQMLRLYEESGKPVMCAALASDTGRYGRLEIRDGLVGGILEKEANGCGWINAGCYLMPVGPLVPLAGKKFSLEKDFLPDMLHKNGSLPCTSCLNFFDIGVPADYERFSNFAAQAAS